MTENIENGPHAQSPTTSSIAHIFEPELTQKCTKQLSRFRNASTDKGSTMVEITHLIGQSKDCIGEQPANTIWVYLKILNSNNQNISTLDSNSGPLSYTIAMVGEYIWQVAVYIVPTSCAK